jgi:hypothetical protein
VYLKVQCSDGGVDGVMVSIGEHGDMQMNFKFKIRV